MYQKTNNNFFTANFTLTCKDAFQVLEKVFPTALRARFQLFVCLAVILFLLLLTANF